MLTYVVQEACGMPPPQPDWLSSSSEGLEDSDSDGSGTLASVAEESKAPPTIAEQIRALQGKVL